MGSSADRHLLVHGAVWLPSQTRHCCLLVLPSDPATGCRADGELKAGADGCCCSSNLWGFMGASICGGQREGRQVWGQTGFGAWWKGYLFGVGGKDSSPSCAWPG